eukprot:CAMPEP_0203821270 /NCGR_PEP_ID=MMETSP0115-20131106/42651_1 /ASSEMBLY_ACC=CAM_ASM_000227 /TAXON_ID=33651 /ORGANISM="Bicosoecid sp, Strain ms1" /LENGTH=312 /DNA_ID=CAMNT_0050730291 /DNA_START=47 /DNA_END=985 /DNA_ORIENTATION=-
MPEGKQIAGCTVCCVLLIASVTMFAVSWGSLEPPEMGVEYNANTLEINDERLFENGRHFLGLGHSFIVYPKTLQTVKFSVETGNPIVARTKDGLTATLDVSFNYRLIATIAEMSALYLDFGEMEEVEIAYDRIARNWVRVVAARYTALQFFDIREEIQSDMQGTLDEQLRLAHGTVDNLQFLQMRLPPAVEDRQTEQNTAKEEAVQAANDLEVALIDAASQVNAARRQAQVIVLDAQAQAQQTAFEAEASIDGATARFVAEQESYKGLMDSLDLTPKELLAYVTLDAIQEGAGKGRGSVWALNVPSDASGAA